MSLISNAMSIPNNQSNFLEKFTVMVSLLGSFQHTIWHQRMAQECFHILWPCAQSGFVGRVNAFLSRNLYRRILTLNKIIDSVGFRDKLFQSTVSVRVKYTFKGCMSCADASSRVEFLTLSQLFPILFALSLFLHLLLNIPRFMAFRNSSVTAEQIASKSLLESLLQYFWKNFLKDEPRGSKNRNIAKADL
ncbi:hypothetical protein BGZ60DRAFT_44880 [Tricladium varicosporioides]|nr:hypothetical protein BGZ60DRAFT_44880 [Hymenoscyphus varicosporioides]